MNIEGKAIRFAKQHKIQITRRLTDPVLFPPSDSPITIFMAGSPGAGKTNIKTLMKFPFFKQKEKPLNMSDELSHFLLHATDKEKQRVFTEAARRANKDQQDIVERSKQHA